MSDRLFFPIIILLAALMVTLSLRPGSGELPKGPIGGAASDYVNIPVEGDQLNRIIAGGEGVMGIIERDGERFLKIEAFVGRQDDDPLKGPYFEIDSDLERAFSDHDVEITMTVRPSNRRGASAFQANYSTGRDGESGWQTFEMSPEWRDYSFMYSLPVKQGDNALDYFGLRPVVPKDSRTIEIKRINFRRVEKPQPGDGA